MALRCWDGPEEYHLFLVKQDESWMAVHAPARFDNAYQVFEVNRSVYGAWDHMGRINHAHTRLMAPATLEDWHLEGVAELISVILEPQRLRRSTELLYWVGRNLDGRLN